MTPPPPRYESSNQASRLSKSNSPRDFRSNDYNHHHDPLDFHTIRLRDECGENPTDHSGDYSRWNGNRAENSISIVSSSDSDILLLGLVSPGAGIFLRSKSGYVFCLNDLLLSSFETIM